MNVYDTLLFTKHSVIPSTSMLAVSKRKFLATDMWQQTCFLPKLESNAMATKYPHNHYRREPI